MCEEDEGPLHVILEKQSENGELIINEELVKMGVAESLYLTRLQERAQLSPGQPTITEDHAESVS